MRQKQYKKLISLIMSCIFLSGCSQSVGPSKNIEQSSDIQVEESALTSEAVSESKEQILNENDRIRKEAEEIIAEHKNKSVSYDPLEDPEKQYNLKEIKNIRMLEIITGEYSINQTKSNFGVGGTDLGVMINQGDETFIFFGDTFKNEDMTDNWRSNVAAITTDKDYTDGITFDRMILTGTGVAKELLRGKKIDNSEMTKIPTGGISIDGTLYLSFMSVKHWGEPGEWDCNYGSVAKSADNGETWEILKQLQWSGDSKFCQMTPVVIGDMVYVPGISGGRNGEANLMRVNLSEYENFEAYEYMTGYLEDGTPVFEVGAQAMEQAYPFIEKPVGELSFLYSEYLQEWLVTYISNEDIVLQTAKEIWGPYSKPVTIAAQKDYPGLYGAFMNPHYVSGDGSKVGFLMSLWSPVYNVAVMEMELVRK